MKGIQINASTKTVLFRIGICAAVLITGFIGMMALASMKSPPKEIVPEERVIKVAAVKASYSEMPVYITGYGQAQPLTVVAIASEVAGRVVAVNPRMDAGEVIEKDELLFAIDDTNYRAAVDEATASIDQLESTIASLKIQRDVDAQRLKTLERSRELARQEYERLRNLFENHHIGTQSGVDAAERAMNATMDQTDQIRQAVTLSPIRLKETQSGLSAARARLDVAATNLERCRVFAPFNCRIRMAAIETGQYVAPGQTVLSIADDSMLEIRVPLDSRDVRKWLKFDDASADGAGAWFNNLINAPVAITWTENTDGHTWTGRLNRVVAFDSKTRTVTVAVRISAKAAANGGSGELPLVEGMFCKVSIPGRAMAKVISLPRWAVSFKNTVYLASKGRLKTTPVTVARLDKDRAYISEGITEGDLVITTRLVDPLENAKLVVTIADDQKEAS